MYQKAQALEMALQQLKRENKALREKLDITEVNMRSFMREMDGLFDQHQIAGMLEDLTQQNLLGESRVKTDEEGGGSTGGSIRRNK